MGCTNKIKSRCGTKVYAICVNYDGNLPEYSLLDPDDCIDLQQTTEELYEKLGDVLINLNLSELDSCETLPPERTVSNVMQYLIDHNCNLQMDIIYMQEMITVMQGQIATLQENQCPPS